MKSPSRPIKKQFTFETIILQLQITSMGNNYQNLPKRPPLAFNFINHQFETTNVQRVKQTPFSNSQVYSIQPPIFVDPVGIRVRQLLQPRVMTHQLFPPSQVLKLAENIVHGLLELQEHGFQAHGDVSTQTIYYDKKSKLFKLTHPIFSPQSGYKQCLTQKRFSLLSPQQLLALTDETSHKQKDMTSTKSDIFILGIILCQIATLLPSNEIYCPQTFVIFDKEIQNRMELIKQYYGGEPDVCNKILKLLGFMLEYDDGVRKDCKEIQWFLTENNGRVAAGPVRRLELPPGAIIRN